MKAPQFEKLFAQLALLNQPQRRQVLVALHPAAGLDRVKDDRPDHLVGIVEADEMFLLESQKGSRKLDRPPRKRGGRAALRGISHHLDCILVARDRGGQTIAVVTGRDALKVAKLVNHLLPKPDPQRCWSRWRATEPMP